MVLILEKPEMLVSHFTEKLTRLFTGKSVKLVLLKANIPFTLCVF